MRLTTAIPLVSLAALVVTVLIALRAEQPDALALFELPTDELPPHAAPPVGTAALAGRLVDPDGAGVADASLTTVVRGRPVWTYSDRDGAFRLEDVDAGPIEVLVLAVGFLPEQLAATAGGEPVELVLGPREDEPLDLARVTRADLAGVLDPGEGTADASEFEVVLLPEAPPTRDGSGLPRRALTDAEGRFRFDDLQHARYRVLVLPPWARGGSWPDLLTGWQGAPELYDHDADAGRPATLPLSVVSGTVEGVLRDDRGRALAGALVEVSPLAALDEEERPPRVFPAASTDASGAFRVPHLPPGRYRVRAWAGAIEREAEVSVPSRGRADPGF